MPQSPLSTPGISGPSQSSNVIVPTPGGSIAKNWYGIATLASALTGQSHGLQALKDQVNALKYIGRSLIHLYPFKLYQLPSILRPNGGDPTVDWRKFRVRAGRVLESDADGTDSDGDPIPNSDPDSEYVPLDPSLDVLIPINTPKFWFWLEISSDPDTSETIATVRYGPDPTAASYTDPANPDNSWDSDNPWTAAPKPDSQHIPIGWVDTQTNQSTYTPIVRQLLRADILVLGSECY